ncbi:MAG: chorismate synthase [Euryarchaeota archaeon]|nr:chorismate synthase [Euryarchaeota archaeon]|tara:strand:+ start:2750 stop:3739 length:990 start_codon:yes stop_codon:yes gene_type:complete
MRMSLGENMVVTLFGESHGPAVGALIEGMPPNIELDVDQLIADMIARRPGSGLASKRKETDEVEILSGVHSGKSTGMPILLLIKNRDVRSKDYSFLPYQPRPGHVDHPINVKTEGAADLRGGGSFSARLTAGLVAAASLSRKMLPPEWKIEAKVGALGGLEGDAGIELAEQARKDGDSLGSRVDLVISGLPVGFGEPWFEGIEPALARALMAIPAARAVEFGRGVNAGEMRGSQHNDKWGKDMSLSEGADGALGGMASGAPIHVRITFKPPSGISKPQETFNQVTEMMEELAIKGRHDPVIAPRARPVVEAVARLVIADLGIQGGYIDE